MGEDGKSDEQIHLFTVRIWLPSGSGQTRWRGKVRHVSSGEQRYFRGWRDLILWLQAMLSLDE